MDNKSINTVSSSSSTLSSLTMDISLPIDTSLPKKEIDKKQTSAKTIISNETVNIPSDIFSKKKVFENRTEARSNEREDTFMIDIAAISQEYSHIDIAFDTNLTLLDDIYISLDLFTKIFYPELNQFGIEKQISKNSSLYPFISLEDKYRTVNKKPFFLCNTILKAIENDLNIPRTCFTPSSLIEITNEFTNMKTLCDLNISSVVASLTWDNVKTIIQNYETNHKKTVIPILAVSILFKTPTPGVKTNVIKIPYRICTKTPPSIS